MTKRKQSKRKQTKQVGATLSSSSGKGFGRDTLFSKSLSTPKDTSDYMQLNSGEKGYCIYVTPEGFEQRPFQKLSYSQMKLLIGTPGEPATIGRVLSCFTDPQIVILCDDNFLAKNLPVTAQTVFETLYGNLIIVNEHLDAESYTGLSQRQCNIVKRSLKIPGVVQIEGIKSDMLPVSSANEQPNFSSQGFWIAVSTERCEDCFEYTPCFAFLLPPGHEQLDLEVYEDQPLSWTTNSSEGFLEEIWSLSANAVERMQSFTKTYYVDSGDETEIPSWANHCQHCSSILDESLMFKETGGGFCPESFQQAEEQIKLHWYDEPFWAYGFGSSSGYWVESLIASEFDVSNH